MRENLWHNVDEGSWNVRLFADLFQSIIQYII